VPILFLPLTYTFEPLEEGELRNKIETFAQEQQYPYEGIYSVDASKRTSKANAFFVGFGKLKRIALFDTLIESHKPDEIVSVLAHEMGHNRKRHILFNMAISILFIGLFYFLFQLLTIDYPWLLTALNLPEDSFYAGFIGAYLLVAYTPLKLLTSWFTNTLSRRFEYQADAYAAKTFGNTEAMSTALKRLSAHNLSNLTPHPLKEQLYYTHPPTVKRVKALQKIKEESAAKKD
jgi:STE24 endopeptidase